VPGIVTVTGGVCAGPLYLKVFAITHETGHGVANIECTNQGINCPQPIGNDAKKHEAWADLIATRILLNVIPNLGNSVFPLKTIVRRLEISITFWFYKYPSHFSSVARD